MTTYVAQQQTVGGGTTGGYYKPTEASPEQYATKSEANTAQQNGFSNGNTSNTSTPAPVAPTSSAQFSGTPTGTMKAPAVITSKAAEDHIAQMESTLKQAQADITAMQVHNAQPKAPAMPQTPTENASDSGSPAPSNTSSTGSAGDLDSQIKSILDNLTSGESGTATPSDSQRTTMDNDNTAIAADQQAEDQVGSSLQSMSAGTYPLSPAEQAQVDSITQTYAAALAAAKTYQQNITGGATAAAADSGLEMYSPEIALGQIKAAINAGSQKVQGVTDKIVAAQSKLSTALQDSDYKTATTLYKQISSDIKLRTDEIGKIQTSVANQTKAMQTNAINTAKLQINSIISSDKLTIQQKQDAVTNALKQGTLDEKTHNDAVKALAAEKKAAQSPSATKPQPTDVQSTEQWLNNTRGTDGYVSPDAYKMAFDSWIASGYQAKDFVKNYPPKQFIDPANVSLPSYLESKTSSGAASASSVASQIQSAFPSAGPSGN